MTATSLARRAAAVALTFLAIAAAHAQSPQADQEAEMKAAVAAAKKVMQSGPAKIALGDQGTLDLPDGYTFVPQPQADQLMKAMGNGVDPGRLGLFFTPEEDSFVVARYTPSGYIKDDEARNWKTDEMLESIKQGTEETNGERTQRGMPAMEIVDWRQKPTYDATSHRLAWAIETKDKGGRDDDHGVNYNTYVLGREGYLSLNLVSDLKTLDATKPFAQALLANTHFNSGKTYADFSAGSDKVAEYGIAALVTGVVAKKIGLFAVIAAFALKFAKLIAVAFFAGMAGLSKFLKRDKAA